MAKSALLISELVALLGRRGGSVARLLMMRKEVDKIRLENNKKTALARLLVLWVTLLLLSVPSALCSDEIKPVIESVVVDQPVTVVFNAIRELRTTNGSHRKLESYKDNQAIIEERFPGLPVVGDSICTYKEIEIPPSRIDYELIRSDRFKMFQGAWVLEPICENRTKVTLSSYLDPGMRVPFWREISRSATERHVKKRLRELQEQAETASQLHEKGPQKEQ